MIDIWSLSPGRGSAPVVGSPDPLAAPLVPSLTSNTPTPQSPVTEAKPIVREGDQIKPEIMAISRVRSRSRNLP